MASQQLTTVFAVIAALIVVSTTVIGLENACHGTRLIDPTATNSGVFCSKANMANVKRSLRKIKPRRYDIEEMGHPEFFHGWADVQGQGAANDYCRFVGSSSEGMRLLCALAGTHGDSDTNYKSAEGGIPAGFPGTWYMRDEDRDGRDDYCRCVGPNIDTAFIVCTRAGPCGFYGSPEQPGQTLTFNRTTPLQCSVLTGVKYMRPEFGDHWKMPSS